MQRLFKSFSLIASLLMLCLLCFFGCSRSEKKSSALDRWMHEATKLKVLSTTEMVGDMVARVGKEHVHPLTLMNGCVDPHSYELVKGDDEKLSGADLVFYNGLGLEHGASMHYALSQNPRAIAVCSPLLEQASDRLIRIDGTIDPHVWMDASLWIYTIQPIVEALSEADPEHAQEYAANGEALKADLKFLDEEVLAIVQAVPEKRRYLVTSHDAFHYFTARYLAESSERGSDAWKKRFHAPEGLAPDGQLSAHNIEDVLCHIEKYQVEYLFPESNVSLDSLKKIHSVAEARGLTIHFAKTPLFGDSMSGGGEEAKCYREMLLHNAHVIAGFLGSKDCEQTESTES